MPDFSQGQFPKKLGVPAMTFQPHIKSGFLCSKPPSSTRFWAWVVRLRNVKMTRSCFMVVFSFIMRGRERERVEESRFS